MKVGSGISKGGGRGEKGGGHIKWRKINVKFGLVTVLYKGSSSIVITDSSVMACVGHYIGLRTEID